MNIRGLWRSSGGVAWGVAAALLAVLASAAVAEEPDPAGSKVGRAKPAYLDQMLQEAWEGASIKPSPAASDSEFLRRAYLDVLGRNPTVKEALAFLESKDPGKRAKLVEYLLADPDYPKNFGNIWTVTLIGRRDRERMVDRTALRSWLRLQFAGNRPWDEVARELLTAKGSNKENGAVNFALSHMEFGAVPLTSISTRVFLGQQIQCTQCHDHPSNDWKQADFWGINAFFKGIRSREVKVTDATGAEVVDHVELGDEPTDAYSTFDRRDGTIRIAFPTFLDGRKISQGKDVDRREALGKFITGPDNEVFPKAFVNRMWGHFLGRGFVQPVDDFGDHNPPSHPELLDQLGADFKAGGYDIKNLIRWIMNSQAYNLTSSMIKENEKDETLFSHMALKPMSPEQLFDSLLTATAAHKAGGGDQDSKRDQWMRQFIFAFATDEGEESSSFQGTIPQALMMMNGDLMEKAVGAQTGGFLRGVLEQATAQRRGAPDIFIINQIYLAALSRAPSTAELNAARGILRRSPDPIPVMEDVFWALLNSNEFVLNR
jgi:hypothetical protein